MPGGRSIIAPGNSMASQPLHLEHADAIATLVLNRPEKRNAMSLAMWQALPALLDRIAADAAIKVLILRGATAEAFSAGADIAEFERVGASESAAREYNEAVEAALLRLAGIEKPTIAQIAGACVGGGCSLALACDLRFAAESSRLGITPARLGICYSLEDTKRLLDLVGPARAKDILFSAQLLNAGEALRIGLVDRVLPQDELAAAVRDYAGLLTQRSAYTIRSAKRIVRLIQAGTVRETDETRALRDGSFVGPDFREGYRAFLEKREPRFG